MRRSAPLLRIGDDERGGEGGDGRAAAQRQSQAARVRQLQQGVERVSG